MGSREEIVVAAMVGVGLGQSSSEWHRDVPCTRQCQFLGKLMVKIHFVK